MWNRSGVQTWWLQTPDRELWTQRGVENIVIMHDTDLGNHCNLAIWLVWWPMVCAITVDFCLDPFMVTPTQESTQYLTSPNADRPHLAHTFQHPSNLAIWHAI